MCAIFERHILNEPVLCDPVGSGRSCNACRSSACSGYKYAVSYPERASGTASLAVCSAYMERYKSTLATTAIAAFGLLAAAHVLHPGNYERSDRNVRVVVIANEPATVPTIWTDPPHRLHGSEPAALMAESGVLLAHRATMALPPGVRAFPRLSSTLVPPVVQSRRDEADPIGDLIRDLDLDQNS